MKLRSLIYLVTVALIIQSSLAKADCDDSVRLLMYKAGEDTVKVVIGSQDYRVPISFESGLGWDDVKDAYHIPPAYAALLKQGRISIYIGCSGASFTVNKHRVN